MSLDLDPIRARLEAACPGPWRKYNSNEGSVDYGPLWAVANDAYHNPPADDDTPWIAVDVHTGLEADADFIAHARDDSPLLLAEVEHLRARLDTVHEMLAIDEFDQDSCTTLETTVDYAVRQYLLVCDSEAKASDENRRLRALVEQAGGECKHGSLARLCGPCSFDRTVPR